MRRVGFDLNLVGFGIGPPCIEKITRFNFIPGFSGNGFVFFVINQEGDSTNRANIGGIGISFRIGARTKGELLIPTNRANEIIKLFFEANWADPNWG